MPNITVPAPPQRTMPGPPTANDAPSSMKTTQAVVLTGMPNAE